MMRILLILILIFTSSRICAQLTSGYIHFDGIDDMIMVPNPAGVTPGTGDITIEFWAKLDSNPPISQPLLSTEYSPSNGEHGFMIWNAVGNTVSVFFGHQQIVSFGLTTCFNHIAVVRQGFDLYVYVNGQVSVHATDTVIDNVNHQSPLWIGSIIQQPQHFKGGIKEIRLWNIARTQSEIQSTMSDTISGSAYPNLTGYWRCDDTTQIVHDYSLSNRYAYRGSVVTIDSSDGTYMTDFITCVPTGIAETNTNDYNLETHPGYFILKPDEIFQGGQISIYDLTGKSVYLKMIIANEISFGENLHPGIYFVEIMCKDKRVRFRFLKE